MDDRIRNVKDKVMQMIERGMQDPDRVDVREMDMLVNMFHHLAEAEASCWSAEYHRKVVEQMGASSPSSVDALRDEYRTALPDRREQIKREAMQMFGMM